MTFEEIVDQALAMLQRRGRVTYRTLQRQFALDEDALNDLKGELLYAHPEVRDDAGRGLIWTSDTGPATSAATAPAGTPELAPLAYTPPYLAEKILTSRSALEGERKQVTVLFADIKDSTEMIRDLDPETAQQLLDPALRPYDGSCAPLRGDREPGHGRWHHGPLRGADRARGSCGARLLCGAGHAGGDAPLQCGGAPRA